MHTKLRLGWDGQAQRYIYYFIQDLGPIFDYPQIFPRNRDGMGRRAGPGVEIHEDPVRRRRQSGEEMTMYTSLE